MEAHASCPAMPREDVSEGPRRVCAECRRAKTIRGVWYLMPGRGPTHFCCETCFSSVARPVARVLS